MILHNSKTVQAQYRINKTSDKKGMQNKNPGVVVPEALPYT